MDYWGLAKTLLPHVLPQLLQGRHQLHPPPAPLPPHPLPPPPLLRHRASNHQLHRPLRPLRPLTLLECRLVMQSRPPQQLLQQQQRPKVRL